MQCSLEPGVADCRLSAMANGMSVQAPLSHSTHTAYDILRRSHPDDESHRQGETTIMAKRRASISYNPGSIEPIIRLWLLRVLVPLGGGRQFVHPHGFNNDTLAEVIGLGHWIDSETRDFVQKIVQSNCANCTRRRRGCGTGSVNQLSWVKTSISCPTWWV